MKNNNNPSFDYPAIKTPALDTDNVDNPDCVTPVTTNTQSDTLAMRKSCLVAECDARVDLHKITNKSVDESGICNKTFGDMLDRSEEEECHLIGTDRTGKRLKYQNNIHVEQKATDSGSDTVEGRQGAVLPPPLFPSVFNGNVFSPFYSRSTFLNDTTPFFKHPLDMFTRGIPYRFPIYYNQMASQSVYRFGGQNITYQMPTHSDNQK